MAISVMAILSSVLDPWDQMKVNSMAQWA